MARLVQALVCLFLVFVSGSLSAQDMTSAIKSYHPKATLLVAERLPDAHWLVEVEIEGLRLPIKVSGEGRYLVMWKPATEYVSALKGLSRSGELPRILGAPSWVDATRTPAFPIVLTRSRIVTPFGVIEPGPPQLDVLDDLAEHSRRWIFEITREDPALARIDMIVDRQATWLQVMQALFSTVNSGYYQVSLVVESGQGLGVINTYSPIVVGSLVAPENLLTVATYPIGTTLGFRVVFGGSLMEPVDSSCDLDAEQGSWSARRSEMSFCTRDRDVLAQHIRKLGQKAIEHRMLVAAPGEMTFGQFTEALNISQDLRARPPILSLVQ